MEENNYLVYMHINKTNGKRYVGLTKRKAYERWGSNGQNYKTTPHFFSAIKKYGWDNFEHIIIKEKLFKEEACELEKKLILEYKTQNKDFGYNILEGGDAPSLTEDIRLKISKALIGNKNGLGKKCTEEKKMKISIAQKGRKLTEEHKKKLSLAKKGTHHTISNETRKKISNSHKKKSIKCATNGNIYESIQECSRILGIEATSICAVCKGRHKTVNGLSFEYVDIINA